MKKELWKPVEGYEGLYELRSDGLLYSHPRPRTKGGYSYGGKVGNGYLKFTLSKNGVEEQKRVNRLVWETFVGQIPDGYDVHHKNHNRTDNRIENLELIEKDIHTIEHIEDRRNGYIEAMSKPVAQYTKDGVFIAEYKSATEAAKILKLNQGNISQCCLGKRRSAGGFVWQFVA